VAVLLELRWDLAQEGYQEEGQAACFQTVPLDCPAGQGRMGLTESACPAQGQAVERLHPVDRCRHQPPMKAVRAWGANRDQAAAHSGQL
jgi:hypothetical protein